MVSENHFDSLSVLRFIQVLQQSFRTVKAKIGFSSTGNITGISLSFLRLHSYLLSLRDALYATFHCNAGCFFGGIELYCLVSGMRMDLIPLCQ